MGAGAGERPDEKAQGGELLESSPFKGDLDSALAAPPRRRLSTLTLVLGAGVMLVAGVILGIQAEKALGGGGQGAMPGAMMRQGTAGPGGYGGYGGGQGPGGYGGGYGGFGGRQRDGGQDTQNGQGGQGNQGARGGMTFGTVQKVEGTKVYVQQPDGTVVTVNTTGQTAVRVSKEGKVADLRSGGTVVVQGARGEDGSITATSINEGGGRR
ncbi:hypothetical protein [Streptosporangium sp. NPDC051022]|uniref:hypothetical protein n=1 Tax=Streptosporangium sp. NPDC051022 TaxID=3155752 RepID=UPI003427ABD7